MDLPKAFAAAEKRTVTLISGDGVGPECINAARQIIEAAGVKILWDEQQAGADVFRKGIASGVPRETIDSIQKTGVVLKGPLETPVGYGEKSANVTLRKLFETYANIRPVRELPGVTTPYSGRGIDLVVVRENVEDLYAGIEHMQTPGVAQCLKLISRKGCEKIVRLAFELARSEGRTTVHCASKANIIKMTEGMLMRTFADIAGEYPDIKAVHIIVDNCAHQLVKKPEQFEIIVTTNMNGDILSDLTSALVGGLGFAPSANIGSNIAIFEAVHGSAPKYAGSNLANPTAVIMSAVMMLRYLGEFTAAAQIESALLVTLEDGKTRTGDIAGYDHCASTGTYSETIIANLGRRPQKYLVRDYKPLKLPYAPAAPNLVKDRTRRVIGADIFVESAQSAENLGRSLDQLVLQTPFRLKMISNRGTKVYPATGATPDCVDHWRCRFILREEGAELSDEQLLKLLSRISNEHSWMHVEKLQIFNDEAGYTMAQGED